MKINMFFALLSMLTITLCCCNNKKKECVDCKALGVTIPAFEKKFPEKRASLDPEYYVEGTPLELAYSSLEEAEFKLTNCIMQDEFFNRTGCELVKKVIQSDASSMSYPFDSLIKKQNFTIVDSDDRQVRCYGWCNMNVTRFMNPELMIQYKGDDGQIFAVEGFDFNDGDYMPEDLYSIYPEKIYRFENGDETYTIIWGLYEIDRWVASYGLIALKLEDDGVHSVPLFKTDELTEGIVMSYCLDWSDEYGYEYEFIRFDKDESSFFFPVRNEKYLWDGNAFVLKKRAEDDSQQLILSSIANGDKETFADLVQYPLRRRYPLCDINNKQEMMANFDLIFDEDFRKTVGKLGADDWEPMGLQGSMILSGEIWEDEGVVIAVNYSSPVEQQKRDSMIANEMRSLHPSLQGNWEPEHRMELEDEIFGLARIDKSTVNDTLYRLSLFDQETKVGEKPVACLYGHTDMEGREGVTYCFRSHDTTAFYYVDFYEQQEGWQCLLWMDRKIPCKH